MVRPVCVLQVPKSPLLACQEVFDLQPCGGVAARLCAESCGDLETTICHSVVSRAKSGPIPEALLSAALLEEVDVKQKISQGQNEDQKTKV